MGNNTSRRPVRDRRLSSLGCLRAIMHGMLPVVAVLVLSFFSGLVEAQRGKYTHSIQAPIIKFIMKEMGDEIYKTRVYTGVPARTRLEDVLKMAQKEYLPKCSTQTLRDWFEHYMKHWETPVRTAQHLSALKARYRGIVEREKGWSLYDTDALESIIDDIPDLYLDEIQERLLLSTGNLWSAATIWRKLRRLDGGYSLKIAQNKASQRSEEELKRYKEARAVAVKNPHMACFIDECGSGRQCSERRRLWAKRGKKGVPSRRAKFIGSHGKRYTLLGACDITGFVYPACMVVEHKTSSSDDDPTKGTVDGERFEEWVEKKLCPTLGDYVLREPRSVVILDNVSFHHSKKVRELVEATGAVLLYTSPYSPELNPIELFFAQYKKYLKRWRNLSWHDAHLGALASITPANARQYFRKCGVPP